MSQQTGEEEGQFQEASLPFPFFLSGGAFSDHTGGCRSVHPTLLLSLPCPHCCTALGHGTDAVRATPGLGSPPDEIDGSQVSAKGDCFLINY